MIKRGKPVPMPEMFDRLAVYNSEVARGLVHTPDYVVQMDALQATFNTWAFNNAYPYARTKPFPTTPNPTR